VSTVRIVDREAPLTFLRTAFKPSDWVAVFLKSYETGRVAQRVGPVSWVAWPRFQAWLRFKNAQGFNVYPRWTGQKRPFVDGQNRPFLGPATERN
jgi:hypothetical protein